LTPEYFIDVKKTAARGWKRVDVPDQHRHEERATLSVNKTIAGFAKRITGKTTLAEGNRRFGKGDYTILHDKKTQKDGVLALLFMDDWKTEWGGEFVLVKNGQTLLRFTPRPNTLLIVAREKGARSFVRYVSHKAKKQSFVVLG